MTFQSKVIKANKNKIDPQDVPIIQEPKIIEHKESGMELPVPINIPEDVLNELEIKNRNSLRDIFRKKAPTTKPN